MSKTVLIGCRLPNGLILELPNDPSKTVELNGLNKAVIIGADHATTEVDAEFWEAWKAKNSDYAPLLNAAIFEAKDAASAKSKAKEVEKVKTGFEPMPQDGAGVSPDEKN